MKNIIKSMAFLYLLTFGILISTSLHADPPAPPPPGGHGSTTNEIPGPVSGPIDGGLGFLLTLGAGFGAKKLYALKREKEEEVTE